MSTLYLKSFLEWGGVMPTYKLNQNRIAIISKRLKSYWVKDKLWFLLTIKWLWLDIFWFSVLIFDIQFENSSSYQLETIIPSPRPMSSGILEGQLLFSLTPHYFMKVPLRFQVVSPTTTESYLPRHSNFQSDTTKGK